MADTVTLLGKRDVRCTVLLETMRPGIEDRVRTAFSVQVGRALHTRSCSCTCVPCPPKSRACSHTVSGIPRRVAECSLHPWSMMFLRLRWSLARRKDTEFTNPAPASSIHEIGKLFVMRIS